MYTLNKFINEYGVRIDHLATFGVTAYVIREYGDTPISELPKKWQVIITALFARYGVDQEG